MRRTTRVAVAVLALASLGGCKPLDDTMVAIFGRSMRDSRSFDPYENPLAPAPNAVAFSSGNFPSAADVINIGQPEGVDVVPFTQQDMNPIGTGNQVVAGLVNPIPPDDEEDLARGEELFNRFCAVCHGPNGIGANAYIAQKHPTVAVYNLAGPAVQGYTDQYIYGMIRVGRGLMPEYGSRISHFDRWKIVNYVRLLQREANAAAAPPEGEG
jgi:mono/diheme cytochrome c family protein